MPRKAAFTLILVLSLLLTGCSAKINGYSIDELQTMHTVMLKAGNSNWGEMDITSDFWTNTLIVVYYDGTIELGVNYNLSGKVVDCSDTLSADDYNTLILFLNKNFANGKSNKGVDASDGSGWTFIYYDPDGEIINQFSGYTYSIQKFETIQNMLLSYMPEYEEPPLYPEE